MHASSVGKLCALERASHSHAKIGTVPKTAIILDSSRSLADLLFPKFAAKVRYLTANSVDARVVAISAIDL